MAGSPADASPAEPRALQVPASLDHLAEVRSFVRDSVAEFGGSKRVADDLVQAVDEATCNVMLHGYKSQPGDIDIEASPVASRDVDVPEPGIDGAHQSSSSLSWSVRDPPGRA